jgi:RimJ/RimL family protein N-acetyltransferase
MSAAPETFATARLDAHRVGPADEDFLVGVFGDPRVTATLGGPRDRDRVRADVARWNGHWDEHAFGLWILVDRAAGAPVGWTMLHRTDTGGPGVEVGWTIGADHWRRGYATEGARAALEIGFDRLGLDEIVAFTLTDNTASRGVMEKLGFHSAEVVDHAGLPHVLYRLDATTWGQRTHG